MDYSTKLHLGGLRVLLLKQEELRIPTYVYLHWSSATFYLHFYLPIMYLISNFICMEGKEFLFDPCFNSDTMPWRHQLTYGKLNNSYEPLFKQLWHPQSGKTTNPKPTCITAGEHVRLIQFCLIYIYAQP